MSWGSNANLSIILGIKIVVDFNFWVRVKIRQGLVWEKGLKGLHDIMDQGSVVHVGDEHFGLVGVADLVVHWDLMHAQGHNDQSQQYDGLHSN